MGIAQRAKSSGYRLGYENCAEVPDPISLSVRGALPSWLEGKLYRNGPGVFDIETARDTTVHIDHWFDGLTVLHRFSIENGGVRYSNRHLASGLRRYIEQHGRADFPSFGNDPCLNLFQKVTTLFRRKTHDPASGEPVQNAPVTVGHLGRDRMVARTDANLLQSFDPETLEPGPLLRYSDFNADFEGQLSAAHSQYDLDRGEYFNYTLKLGREGRYTVFCIPDDAPEGHVLAKIDAPPAYIHSFALTPRYFVLIVYPTKIDPLQLLWNRNVVDSMTWKPEQGTLFYVVDRERRELAATYRSEPFFAFHNVNAFEDDRGDILIDLSAYDDASVIDSLRLDRLRDEGMELTGRLRRYRLGDPAGADPGELRPARYDVLCEMPCELPRINQKTHMRGSRFVYGVSGTKPNSVWNRLVKVDLAEGTSRTWSQEDCFPGEPIFVAAPDAKDEDEGVVLSVILDAQAGNSFLLVLDARSFTELARAENSPRVPFGFHGNFFGAGRQEQ